MTTDALVTAINLAMWDLREAKRYVRSNPDASLKIVDRAHEILSEIFMANSGGIETAVIRLIANLDAGQSCIRSAPGVLEGYIEGAAYELDRIKGNAKKELS